MTESDKICETDKHLDKFTKHARKKLGITWKEETLDNTTMNTFSSENIHFAFILLILFPIIIITVWECCWKLL